MGSGHSLAGGSATGLVTNGTAGNTAVPYCLDPVEAVLKTLGCVETEDAACAAAGYAAEFTKIHNGIQDETATGLDGEDYWPGAFFVVDLGLEYNFIDQVDTNRISLRYVESVKTLNMSKYTLPNTTIAGPDTVTIFQYEHALVDVSADCKMIKWDQYGDNKEQADVGIAVDATVPFLGQYIACLSGPNPASC